MPVSVDLSEALCVCIRGCLAAQRYIAIELLQLHKLKIETTSQSSASSILDLCEADKQQLLKALKSSVSVDVKANLDYKEGDDATADLVTTADIVTQAVLVRLLAQHFPTTPFTIVGEEDSPDTSLHSTVTHCIEEYYDAAASIPGEEAFAAYLSRNSAAAHVTADDLDGLRRRVGVYIDPIDGTNCFVCGIWQAPMTLIGLTVDGLPVAGVVNRVFLYPIGSSPAAATDSLSYVWNVGAPAGAADPFLFHGGLPVDFSRLPPLPACAAGAVLQVARSSSKAELLSDVDAQLKPDEPIFGRGAGNKQFFLVDKTLSSHKASPHPTADVYVCPGNTIKKWDCCAPQAFLIALGGDIYTPKGEPLRYLYNGTESVSDDAFTNLPDGVVAFTRQSKAEVARRLGWATV